MARLRKIDTAPDDERAQQLVWARYIARASNIAGLGAQRPGERSHADYYMALSADELRELVERDRDYPASKQILKHLRFAEEAPR